MWQLSCPLLYFKLSWTLTGIIVFNWVRQAYYLSKLTVVIGSVIDPRQLFRYRYGSPWCRPIYNVLVHDQYLNLIQRGQDNAITVNTFNDYNFQYKINFEYIIRLWNMACNRSSNCASITTWRSLVRQKSIRNFHQN